jgi:RNA polymerase sigma-70 factor, ECF subfamily
MLLNFEARTLASNKTFASNREQENKFVKSCQNGDASAWNELIARHTSRVYGMCYRFTRRECVARDMTQEVFLRIYRRLGSFRADELSFVAWMNLLTLNLLRDHYRRTRKERMTVPIDEYRTYLGNISHSSIRPDEIFAHEETRRMVHSALDKLKPDLREMILLCDVQELRYDEIASRLGIPIGTVKSRLNRARASLAHFLRRNKQAA